MPYKVRKEKLFGWNVHSLKHILIFLIHKTFINWCLKRRNDSNWRRLVRSSLYFATLKQKIFIPAWFQCPKVYSELSSNLRLLSLISPLLGWDEKPLITFDSVLFHTIALHCALVMPFVAHCCTEMVKRSLLRSKTLFFIYLIFFHGVLLQTSMLDHVLNTLLG